MILTQCLSEWVSPSWRAPKRPAEPSTASPMNWSSPSTHCHFLTPTHFWPRRSLKMSTIHLACRSGSPFTGSNLCPPSRVSFLIWLPSVHGVCVPLGEHLVDGVHDALPNVSASAPGPLSKPDEVVDENFDVRNQPRKDQEGCMVSQLQQRSWLG